MSQVYNKIVLDVKKKSNDIITAVQNDANSRFLDVVVTDNGIPINLTGHEVRIYGRKYDGTEIYNDGVITDATEGRCQFELTSQALVVANDLQVNVVISKDNKQILSTPIFTIHVVKSLLSDSAIESSNEYGALVVLFHNLYEAYDLMTEMLRKIGEPEEKAQALKLDTMFAVWDYLIDYLEKNSSAGVVDTLNVVNGKIGNVSDTGTGTIMAKLNTLVKVPTIKSIQSGFVSSGAIEYPKGEEMGRVVNISRVSIGKSILITDQGVINNGSMGAIRFKSDTQITQPPYHVTNTSTTSYATYSTFRWHIIEYD